MGLYVFKKLTLQIAQNVRSDEVWITLTNTVRLDSKTYFIRCRAEALHSSLFLHFL